MENPEGTSRRDFLKFYLAGGMALGAIEALGPVRAEAASQAAVVLAGDADLRTGTGATDPARMAALLDRAMQRFFETDDPVTPWKHLVSPGQVVGLKVNTIAGRGLSTNITLVEAVAARLRQAGIAANDIVVWDRTDRELERAGFHLTASAAGQSFRCMGTDQIGYEEDAESHGSVTCRISKILTRVCDTVINLPLLKDHGYSGMTLALKNMYGVIHNPQECHAGGCNPGVADVNMLPTIRNKVRFAIADLTTVAYEGGPGYRPQYAWQRNAIMVAEDPVALDTVGWRIIEDKRAEKGLATLEAAGRPPRYLATAADEGHRLGVNDPNRISLIEA